jgi:multidrug resistance efflux pump
MGSNFKWAWLMGLVLLPAQLMAVEGGLPPIEFDDPLVMAKKQVGFGQDRCKKYQLSNQEADSLNPKESSFGETISEALRRFFDSSESNTVGAQNSKKYEEKVNLTVTQKKSQVYQIYHDLLDESILRKKQVEPLVESFRKFQAQKTDSVVEEEYNEFAKSLHHLYQTERDIALVRAMLSEARIDLERTRKGELKGDLEQQEKDVARLEKEFENQKKELLNARSEYEKSSAQLAAALGNISGSTDNASKTQRTQKAGPSAEDGVAGPRAVDSDESASGH